MDEDFFQPLINVEYDEEIEFNGFIRKHLICVLTGLFFYLFSFYIIRCFITRTENDELYAGDEDFLVYRVSIWMCSASLAVAFGANILLPFSMIGLEILHVYPDNFYTKWLNGSLIVSMWNYVFFLSNLSLFIFLPFSYFFIESQGLSFLRRPQRPFLARVYETILVCMLVIVVLIGIVDVAYSLLLQHTLISFSLFYFTSLSTPLLYSIFSSFGVFVLLLSTPFGFVKMFDVFSDSLRKSSTVLQQYNNARNAVNKEHFFLLMSAQKLQQKTFERKQRRLIRDNITPQSKTKNSTTFSVSCGGESSNKLPPAFGLISRVALPRLNGLPKSSSWNGGMVVNPCETVIFNKKVRPTLNWCFVAWNLLKYPVMMLVLIFFAALSVTLVAVNTLRLLFGFRALPDYVQYVEVNSRHTFGILGALVEIAVILYIILASFVGIYSLPLIRNIRPKYGKTSMTSIILNCGIVLLLSSALPVLARILGITSFDLLGAYGQINWISNFLLVICYNILFASCSIFCLVNKFTLSVRRELIRRFSSLYNRKFSGVSTSSCSTPGLIETIFDMEKVDKLD